MFGACTNDPSPPTVLGNLPSADVGERCAAAIEAAEARWAAEAGDSLAEVDAAVRGAVEARRARPVSPGDVGVLAEEVARWHARVDVDFNRLHAARQEWEAAKRALAADAIALDQAIDRFENAPE